MNEQEISPEEFNKLAHEVCELLSGLQLSDCLSIIGRVTNNIMHEVPADIRKETIAEWVTYLLKTEIELTKIDEERKGLH